MPFTPQQVYELSSPDPLYWEDQTSEVRASFASLAGRLNHALAEQEQPQYEKQKIIFSATGKSDDAIAMVKEEINAWFSENPNAIVIFQDIDKGINAAGEDQYIESFLVEVPVQQVDVQDTLDKLGNLGYVLDTERANAEVGENAMWAFLSPDRESRAFCHSEAALLDLLRQAEAIAEWCEPAPDAFDQFLPGQEVARTQPLTEEVAE